MYVYDDPNCVTFTDLLDSTGLEQHVKSPTQLHSHILDLIITRKSDSLVAGTPFCDNFHSGHCTVLCNLNMSKSNRSAKKVSYRKIIGKTA